ncbi:MAG: ABC transporter permease [Planctomycetaceae bacterium]
MSISTTSHPTSSRELRVSSPLVHLAWKEFRTVRTLWIILAFIGVAGQVLSRMFGQVERGNVSANYVFSTVYFLPLMFAMGAAVLSFAWEKEEKTWNLLRVLPMSRGTLFAAKFGVGFLMSVALFVLLWFSAWVVAPQPYPSEKHLVVLGWGSYILQLFAWGAFFSLVAGRVLLALILAPVAMIFTSGLPHSYLLIPLVAAADYWLTGRWLADKSFAWPRFLTRRRARAVPKRALFIRDTADPWKVAFARLVWLEWQQAKPFLWLMLGVGLVVVPVTSHPWFDAAFQQYHIPLFFLGFIPILAGAWSFQNEQHQRRYRIAAARGVAPEALWLTKHVVWFPVAILIVSLLVLLQGGIWLYFSRTVYPSGGLFRIFECPIWEHTARWLSNWYSFDASHSETFWSMLLYCAIGYAAGQLGSMLLSRTVTAFVLSLPIVFVSLLWWGLMKKGDIPAIWTVGPIPIVLLLATLLRAPDWLLERTGWRRWPKIAAAILLPIPIVVAGIAIYRVTEIPALYNYNGRAYERPYLRDLYQIRTGGALSDVPQRPMTPWTAPELVDSKGLPVFEQGVRAHDKSMPDAGRRPKYEIPFEETRKLRNWVLDQANAAHQAGTSKAFHNFRSAIEDRHREFLRIADELTNAGKLDEAFTQLALAVQLTRHASKHGNLWFYRMIVPQMVARLQDPLLLWLGHPDQVERNVSAATRTLDLEFSYFETYSAKLLENRDDQFAELDRNWKKPASELRSESGTDVERFIAARRFLPWEKWRLERLIDAGTAASFHDVRPLEFIMFHESRANLATWYLSRVNQFWENRLDEPWKWWYTTIEPPSNWGTETSVYNLFNQSLHTTISRESRTRLMVLTSALVAYRLHEKHLPAQLEELVPSYLAKVPVDPWTGFDYCYYPEGLSEQLYKGRDQSIPARTPLIYSPGTARAEPVKFTPSKPGDEPTTYHLVSGNYYDGQRLTSGEWSSLNAGPIIIELPPLTKPVEAQRPKP